MRSGSDRVVGDPALRVDIISFYLPRSLHFLLRTSTRLALRRASSRLSSSPVPRRLEYNSLPQMPCPKKGDDLEVGACGILSTVPAEPEMTRITDGMVLSEY